jgi:choline dehydrogenase
MGPYHLTIKHGRRCSAAAAYLSESVVARSNLHIIPRAYATRILIENGAARGVEYCEGPGKPARRALAGRELILAAGVFQTPQLLMLSGIGPAEHLAKLDVPVVADVPELGGNLQDHLDVSIIYECTKPITVYSLTKGHKRILVGLEYAMRGTGPGRSNHLHAGAFLKTRGELDRPDLQLHFVNSVMIEHAKVQADRDGFTIHACQLRPESRGSVRLKSTDPFDAPLIDPNYLAAETDRRTLRDSVRIVRDIVRQDALKLFRGPEMRPGPEVRTDAEIDAWIRATAETIYHPVGTCRMGVDPGAPVDGELRLRALKNLRVIDASVMPTLVGGNTNAPTIMIAEKAADMILGKPAPAPIDAPIAEDARAAV